jgi:hypothetical protein
MAKRSPHRYVHTAVTWCLNLLVLQNELRFLDTQDRCVVVLEAFLGSSIFNNSHQDANWTVSSCVYIAVDMFTPEFEMQLSIVLVLESIYA